MLSFADLAAILLAFFVLTFSMQRLDMRKWNSLVRQVNVSIVPSDLKFVLNEPRTIAQEAARGGDDLAYLSTLFEGRAEEAPAMAAMRVQLQDDRLVLSLPSALLFSGDGAAMTRQGRGLLSEISRILGNVQPDRCRRLCRSRCGGAW